MMRQGWQLALIAVIASAAPAAVVTHTLSGSLDTGSLAGTKISVTFSYDAAEVQPTGDSWVSLQSFDFTLGPVRYSKAEISQGGQVVFRSGRLDNVTASYQSQMPANSVVNNVTFGFGGPGVIGYIDRNGQYGLGSFTVNPTCLLSFSPDLSRITGDGASNVPVTVSVSSPACTWSLATSAPWIAMDRLSGTGAATLMLSVYPNFGTALRTASIVAGGPSTYVSQTAAGGSADERYVRLMYFAFTGRLPSAAETAFQVTEGVAKSGRAAVALNLFNSAEFGYGGRFVAGLYFGLLNRTPEYVGWLFQRNALTRGVVYPTVLVRNFLESAEFTQAHPGLSDPEFVRLLYRQILLREASQAEVDFQVSVGLAGGRVALASQFLGSAEFQQKLGGAMTAFFLYATLLGRDASPGELDWRATQLRQGTSVSRLISDFLAAPEFFAQLQ